MQKIEIQEVTKYTKELSLLYVEDDLQLQTKTQRLLSLLFNHVEVANDGLEALDIYKRKDFDIVITDIKMPNMDGRELISSIKNINKNQVIIITSAYNDPNDLLDFINLDIHHFILKPVEFEQFKNILYTVSKNIINQKMVALYRKNLETTNQELRHKNSELESLIRILNSKLTQVSTNTQDLNLDLDYSSMQLSNEHLNELKDLEIDIMGASVLIRLPNHLTMTNIGILGDMFLSYANILVLYGEYQQLTSAMYTLAEALNNASDNFAQNVEDISTPLESLMYILGMWRIYIVENNVQKAFELHTSMTQDIETIIATINEENKKSDGDL